MQAYCVKCREKRDLPEDAKEVAFGKKGTRRALKGDCSVCSTGLFRILPGKLGDPMPEAKE